MTCIQEQPNKPGNNHCSAPKHTLLKSTSHCSKPLLATRISKRSHTASEVKQVYCCHLPCKRHLEEPHLELLTIPKCSVDDVDRLPGIPENCSTACQKTQVLAILKRTMVVLIFKQRESCSYSVCFVGLL